MFVLSEVVIVIDNGIDLVLQNSQGCRLEQPAKDRQDNGVVCQPAIRQFVDCCAGFPEEVNGIDSAG